MKKNVTEKKTKEGTIYTVRLNFSPEQFEWIQGAADRLTDGRVHPLVWNLFWREFESVTKEIATGLADEKVEN